MPKNIRTPSIIFPSKVGRTKRIRIPPSAYRPYMISGGNVLKWEQIDKDPWWMVVHKRGPRRRYVGTDPREMRAEQGIAGTLPERILYKTLEKFGYKAGVDFDFQTSMGGGRQELGGMVADFMFFMLRLIIQVLGPTHDTFIQGKKDSEQTDILSAMGFTVLEIEEETCYNEYLLEEWMRKNFGLVGVNGGCGVGRSFGSSESEESPLTDTIYETTEDIYDTVSGLSM